MDDDLPVWLTKEFLETTLQDGRSANESSIAVTNYEVTQDIPEGDNYVCIIYRVNIDYKITEESRNASIILKVPHPIEATADIKKAINNEIFYYKEIMPRINAITKESLNPKSFESTQEDVLILQDITKTGYKMVDRKKQIDYDHALVALETLAKFHAASVKILEEDQELVMKIVGEKFFYHKNNWARLFTESFVRIVSEEIKQWPESKDYSESLSEYEPVIWDRLCDLFLPNEEEFMVLNHGDVWTANMMFKYSNGKPIKAKLLDLQFTRYCSPASDLVNFLNGSVRNEVRLEKLQELKKLYLSVLNSSLEKYGSSKRLHEDDLDTSMKTRELQKIFISCCYLPMSLTEEPAQLHGIELDKMSKENTANNPLRSNLKSNSYRKILSDRLVEYEKVGLVRKIKK